MRTILYQPVYINPQAHFVFPSLYHIEKGDSSDTNILSLGANAYNLNLGRCQEFSNVAIYYFALYDKSLTPDEIEQEKIKLNEIWTKRLNG